MCWPKTLDALERQILHAQTVNGGRKITLVSHSMGALVVRCLMQTRPQVLESGVERWVAIAAPYQGAGAKILLEFLQGYNLGNIVIDAEDAKVLSLESPAVYELLPQEHFPWVLAPYISVGKLPRILCSSLQPACMPSVVRCNMKQRLAHGALTSSCRHTACPI